MGDEERDPIDIDMRPVQDQVDDMLKGFNISVLVYEMFRKLF